MFVEILNVSTFRSCCQFHRFWLGHKPYPPWLRSKAGSRSSYPTFLDLTDYEPTRALRPGSQLVPTKVTELGRRPEWLNEPLGIVLNVFCRCHSPTSQRNEWLIATYAAGLPPNSCPVWQEAISWLLSRWKRQSIPPRSNQQVAHPIRGLRR